IELKNVIVLANFDVVEKEIIPYFSYTGTWYDLLDESTLNVTSTGTDFKITLQPGEFHVFGNQLANMSVEVVTPLKEKLLLVPNPTSHKFSFSKNVQSVEIYDLTGKKLKEFKGDFAKGKSFDVSNLPAGIYLVKSISDFEISTNRLIKK